jgi:hypothetical protein
MSEDLEKRVKTLEAQMESLGRIAEGLVQTVGVLVDAQRPRTPEDNHRAIKERRAARRLGGA